MKTRMIILSFVLGTITLGGIGMNALAWMHARAMTSFVETSDPRTQPPESLGFTAKLNVLFTGVQLPRPTAQLPPTAALAGEPKFEVHHYSSNSGHTIEAWSAHVTSERLFILFHPYGSSKGSMVNIAQALLETGHSVMLVDFYGSGGSSGNTTSIGYFEALDVVASVTYARKQWQPQQIYLYGASMGGAAVLRAVAIHEMAVDAIAIESSFDSLLHTVQNRFTAMNLPTTPLAELLTFWGGQQQGFNGFAYNPADYAAKVAVPTLVIHGEGDRRVTLSQSQAIYANLTGWKQFSIYPGPGHGASLNQAPTQWQSDIQQLIQATNPGD